MLKNMKDMKAILFDLDDTLLNSKLAEYNAICEFKSYFNGFNKIDNKKFAEMWSKITAKLYEQYNNRKISFEDQRIQRIKQIFLEFGINISDEDAKNKFDMYLELYEKNWLLFDDVIEVLTKLKDKYKLAIVSNGDSFHQRRKLQKVGIEKYFSEIIISSEVGFSKPNKEIFEITCKKLNVNPQECIMIGDKYKVDIEGSINAGITAIWVNRKNEKINYKIQIKQLRELFNFI
jgi:putative hydrolase of the HAD superfamily